MGKEKTVGSPTLAHEMFQLGRYKRTQGRIARQVTLIAIGLIIAIGAWQMYEPLRAGYGQQIAMSISGLVLVIGLWCGYRLINWPTFADFLISVEAEMNKVTWPAKAELWRSSLVVMFLMFALAACLLLFDVIWGQLFQWIGIS
jgi:preprotein translocase subunit SecE